MPPRHHFPFLLWRFLSADLLRLVGMSASVLVAVIAFAGAVKPMSDGLLQSSDLPKFILYAIPPMLAYALPLAAGFAATLVYHRFASDNEVVAAHAGGISHRAILSPALAIGLVLALVIGILNEFVNPMFLRRIEHMITRDLATWIVQEVNKGKAVEAGGMSIFADSGELMKPEPGSNATDMLVLRKFAAIERNKEGTPTTEVTSEKAWIWLFPWEGTGEDDGRPQPQSRVVMRLENVIGLREGRDKGAFEGKLELAWTLPNPFRDNPKFMPWNELRALRDFPERITRVDLRRRELAMFLAEKRAVTDLRASAATSQQLELRDEDGRTIVITTSGLEQVGDAWRLLPASDGVITAQVSRRPVPGVQENPSDRPTILKAASAMLVPSMGSERFNRAFDFKVDLTDVRVTETTSAGATTTRRPTYRLPALRPAANPAPPLLALTSPELLAVARNDPVLALPNPRTADAIRELSDAVRIVTLHVLSKQHERVAIAISCLIMTLTGAVTALRLSKRTPLMVYMFTFLPAILCLVTISGGQQATLQMGAPGLLLMWSGVIGLGLYTLLNYRVLIRN